MEKQIWLAEKLIVPPFGSPGGKYKVRKLVVKLFPQHTVYVESYVGSGAIFYAKKASETEILNDLDKDIYFAYKFIKSVTPEAIKSLETRNWVSSDRLFKKLRAEQPSDSLDRIYRFLYLKHASYGKVAHEKSTYSHYGSGKRLGACLKRLEECKERLKTVKILNKDALSVIKEHDSKDTFVYLDPPYEEDWKTNSMGTKEFRFEDLVGVCKSMKGNFLLSYEDSKKARDLLKGFEIRYMNFRREYHRSSGVPDYIDKEIVAANYDLPRVINKHAADIEYDELSKTYFVVDNIIKSSRDYLIEQPPDKQFDFVVQYHTRDIWASDECSNLKDRIIALKKDATEESQVEWETIWTENNIAYLETSLKELSEDLEREEYSGSTDVDDNSVVMNNHFYTDGLLPPKLEDVDIYRLFRIGNCHADLRFTIPNRDELLGMTFDIVKIALQNLDDELYFPVRDRFLENNVTDTWFAQLKDNHSNKWLELVTKDKPEYEIVPENSRIVNRFVLKAVGHLIFGCRKHNYHEYLLNFSHIYHRNSSELRGHESFPSGRFEFSLLNSKELNANPIDEIWVGNRPSNQSLEMITGVCSEEDNNDIVWNHNALSAVEEFGYPITKSVSILKLLKDQQIAIGPVLIPNAEDLQGDTVLEEDVERAAHKSMEQLLPIQVMHDGEKVDAVRVESYVYRNFGKRVPEGTWISAVKVRDKRVWDMIKEGKLRGFSIGGTGTRHKPV